MITIKRTEYVEETNHYNLVLDDRYVNGLKEYLHSANRAEGWNYPTELIDSLDDTMIALMATNRDFVPEKYFVEYDYSITWNGETRTYKHCLVDTVEDIVNEDVWNSEPDVTDCETTDYNTWADGLELAQHD